MATEPLLIQKNRSKVMAKYYLTKIIYNGLTYFLIWYSNDEDGFLLFDQQLIGVTICNIVVTLYW